MTEQIKKHASIGCCGIDCGLCPRFYTKGDSACPGCGGANFNEKHPLCGFLTCCTSKKQFEVCSYCVDYPCKRFDSEKNGYDSFVTHKRVFTNLNFIQSNGIEQFINQQARRIDTLQAFLTHYDDGRSKSFFCLSCALLPLDELDAICDKIGRLDISMNLKEKNKYLRDALTKSAETLNIELRLNNKK